MDFKEQQREAASLKKDISKASGLINDSINRYVKMKLKARSKKQAEDMKALFADLEPYGSKNEIQDSYGFADMTMKEYDRLMLLWDEREQYVENGKKYCDRVVEMLTYAKERIIDKYVDFLDEAEKEAWENLKNQQGRS